MRPLAELDAARLSAVSAVLADIDDTITTRGRITSAALAAMERVRHAGLAMIPVTGRPAGWCDHIARMWPVDAVVGENGAFWFRYHAATRRMERRYLLDAATRTAHRAKLESVAREILAAVPGAALAADQPWREADLAIDFCEDVERLSPSSIDEIVALMQAHQLTVKVSSIHVNGWIGTHDKLTTTVAMLHESFGAGSAEVERRCLFVGDSPNDQPMFAHFPLSVGVANVRAFRERLTHPPAYVTCAEAGDGFVELVDHLLARRGAHGVVD